MYINEEGTGGELTLEQFREFLHGEEQVVSELPDSRKDIGDLSFLDHEETPPPAALVDPPKKPGEIRSFEVEGEDDHTQDFANPLKGGAIV